MKLVSIVLDYGFKLVCLGQLTFLKDHIDFWWKMDCREVKMESGRSVRRFSVVRDDGDLGQSDSREMVQFS
jgi:hypothetical protein